MKKIFIMLLAVALAVPMWAQDKKAKAGNEAGTETQEAFPKVYDEDLDGMAQIDQALADAQASGRKVVCQVGGNWCPWCLRFAKFITDDEEIASVIKDNYVYVHINTSKANKNLEALQRLRNPGRFGYPVLVILDHDGNVLHTQNSAYLEEGKGYSRKKVLEFFRNWTDEAIETLK